MKPFHKGGYYYRKAFAYKEIYSFLYELTPIEKRGQQDLSQRQDSSPGSALPITQKTLT